MINEQAQREQKTGAFCAISETDLILSLKLVCNYEIMLRASLEAFLIKLYSNQSIGKIIDNRFDDIDVFIALRQTNRFGENES